jgi:hypothetical protein
MSKLAVTNTNIVVESIEAPKRRKRPKKTANTGADWGRSEQQTRLRALAEKFRRHVDSLVCSSAWAEDCLFRGANYEPDFRCSCNLCQARFPKRLHPRPVRETAVSLDCQVEIDADPDLADDLRRLRNERERIGSAFVARRQMDRGSGSSRRITSVA